MKDDTLYLCHIHDAINKILSYTRNGREAFMSNPMEQDAVIRNLEIIGEAAKRLSDELKLKESTIPWRAITGLRNVLIHDYMGVDLEEVWNVVSKHIPGLHATTTRILSES